MTAFEPLDLKLSPEFGSLKESLKGECRVGNTYFFANPGNWGDALIRQGAVNLLADAGIEFIELKRDPKSWIIPFLRGGTFVYGGSGAWCRFYNTGEKYARLFSSRFRVIVLPSTFDRRFSVQKTRFYCRDKFESKSMMPEASFCHDMAFYLGPQCAKMGNGRGHFFRKDAERLPVHQIPDENRDVSREGNQLSSADMFIAEIAKSEVIVTDRLHVAIAGCLLGREVHLYANNYFKIEAIYKSSILGKYPGCTMHLGPYSPL